MSEDEKFIAEAIEHPGSLKRWAKMHGFENQDGTINLPEARAYAKRHGLTHRLRQINLATTLRKFKR